MFDASFAELTFIAIIALVVLGPERLPVVARKLGRFIGSVRRTFTGFQHEIERHMQVVEEPLKDVRREFENEAEDFASSVNEATSSIETEVNSIVSDVSGKDESDIGEV